RFTQLGKFMTIWRQFTASPYSWIDALMFDAYEVMYQDMRNNSKICSFLKCPASPLHKRRAGHFHRMYLEKFYSP
ncbi:MAG: hypothetical protein FWF80_03360, partial [Defluviitaleaceae bacterium]|nr:hypothetical protein [Defluviitaleaceae bacterium]